MLGFPRQNATERKTAEHDTTTAPGIPITGEIGEIGCYELIPYRPTLFHTADKIDRESDSIWC